MEKLELWKIIEDYNNYEISNYGRVRSLNYNRTNQVCIMINRKISSGYLAAHLSKKGVSKNKLINRLVAIAFIPNPENKPFVNHINGIKTDNRVENLEWNTAKENTQHSFGTGLQISLKGEDHVRSKLTKVQVLEIRKSNLKQIELAQLYGVHKVTICNIKKNRIWKHI